VKRYLAGRNGCASFRDFVGSLSDEGLADFARWEPR